MASALFEFQPNFQPDLQPWTVPSRPSPQARFHNNEMKGIGPLDHARHWIKERLPQLAPIEVRGRIFESDQERARFCRQSIIKRMRYTAECEICFTTYFRRQVRIQERIKAVVNAKVSISSDDKEQLIDEYNRCYMKKATGIFSQFTASSTVVDPLQVAQDLEAKFDALEKEISAPALQPMLDIDEKSPSK